MLQNLLTYNSSYLAEGWGQIRDQIEKLEYKVCKEEIQQVVDIMRQSIASCSRISFVEPSWRFPTFIEVASVACLIKVAFSMYRVGKECLRNKQKNSFFFKAVSKECTKLWAEKKTVILGFVGLGIGYALFRQAIIFLAQKQLTHEIETNSFIQAHFFPNTYRDSHCTDPNLQYRDSAIRHWYQGAKTRVNDLMAQLLNEKDEKSIHLALTLKRLGNSFYEIVNLDSFLKSKLYWESVFQCDIFSLSEWREYFGQIGVGVETEQRNRKLIEELTEAGRRYPEFLNFIKSMTEIYYNTEIKTH